MKLLSKLLSINLLALLGLNIISLFLDDSIGRLLVIALWVVFQFILNMLLGMIEALRKKYDSAKTFVLCALIIFLIGFSTCMLQFALWDVIQHYF